MHFCNLHEMAANVSSYIHTTRTHTDFVFVCGQRQLLDELDRLLLLKSPSARLFSYDTTFELGGYYVSVLCFRHTLLIVSPVIPVAFWVHKLKIEEPHN